MDRRRCLSKRLNDSRGRFPSHTRCYTSNQFGSFQAASLPEAIPAIFTCQVFAAARRSHLQFDFRDASAAAPLFDRGFVRRFLLVYAEEMLLYEKVRSQMKNMNICAFCLLE